MNNLIEFIIKEQIGEYKENVSFKTLTTYKTGGNAKLVLYPFNVLNLQKAIDYMNKNKIDYKVFGNGSNILASDKDYNGVIIKLNKFDNISIENNIITVGAGYSLMRLALDACKNGFTGLEFACGIPATLGGAVYMNAGAYLKDMSTILESAKVLTPDNEIKVLTKEEIDFSYRHSSFMNNGYIILEVVIKLEQGNKDEIMALVNERRDRRKETQPLEYPSAGSVFRNPENNFAGKLIEDCNLKGFTYKEAQISGKHANFIINLGNAKSADIKYLMDKAKQEVKEKFDIEIKEEQELFNWE